MQETILNPDLLKSPITEESTGALRLSHPKTLLKTNVGQKGQRRPSSPFIGINTTELGQYYPIKLSTKNYKMYKKAPG